MPNRKIHIILSAPVYLMLYVYTVVVVLLILIMAYLHCRRGVRLLSGFWARSIFPLIGKKVHIKGKENIKKGERYILLTNHASMFDIMAIMAFYPDVSWFGHERLLRIPLFKQMLLITDYIPMHINNIRNTRIMLNNLEEKAKDRTVAIFPEGTRTLNGKLNSFYRGFIHLLRATEHDILPVTLNGFYKLKPKNRFSIHFGSRLEVFIHPPLEGKKMANKEKWCFIVNPTAGGGSGKKLIPRLEEQLAKRTLDATILLTERHNHAIELSKRCLEDGCTHIIAVGGDGTMNEVARPLIGQKQLTTGLIPAGTGNDFIQILGFPDRFSETDWDIFFRQSSIHMDVGQVNGLHFLNGMGLGFDAQVAAENYVEPGEVAKASGKGKYIWHIVKTLLFYKEVKVTITSRDKQQESDCFINTISVGRRFAGSFFLTPEAIANDGLLDVCMIRKLNLLQRFKILSMVPKGTHVRDKKVDYYQTEKINVDFGKKSPFMWMENSILTLPLK